MDRKIKLHLCFARSLYSVEGGSAFCSVLEKSFGTGFWSYRYPLPFPQPKKKPDRDMLEHIREDWNQKHDDESEMRQPELSSADGKHRSQIDMRGGGDVRRRPPNRGGIAYFANHLMLIQESDDDNASVPAFYEKAFFGYLALTETSYGILGAQEHDSPWLLCQNLAVPKWLTAFGPDVSATIGMDKFKTLASRYNLAPGPADCLILRLAETYEQYLALPYDEVVDEVTSILGKKWFADSPERISLFRNIRNLRELETMP